MKVIYLFFLFALISLTQSPKQIENEEDWDTFKEKVKNYFDSKVSSRNQALKTLKKTCTRMTMNGRVFMQGSNFTSMGVLLLSFWVDIPTNWRDIFMQEVLRLKDNESFQSRRTNVTKPETTIVDYWAYRHGDEVSVIALNNELSFDCSVMPTLEVIREVPYPVGEDLTELHDKLKTFEFGRNHTDIVGYYYQLI